MTVLKETSKIPGGFDFTILNHYFLIYIIDTSIKAQKTCIKTCIASINISLESHIRVNETVTGKENHSFKLSWSYRSLFH